MRSEGFSHFFRFFFRFSSLFRFSSFFFAFLLFLLFPIDIAHTHGRLKLQLLQVDVSPIHKDQGRRCSKRESVRCPILTRRVTQQKQTQKNPFSVRKIFVRNSGAGNGCINFMDAWKNAFFLQEKPMSIKLLVLGGGFGFFLGGGSADFIFMGARIFLTNMSA